MKREIYRKKGEALICEWKNYSAWYSKKRTPLPVNAHLKKVSVRKAEERESGEAKKNTKCERIWKFKETNEN